MKENLNVMTFRTLGMTNILLVMVIVIFGVHPWYFLMLTSAQLVFVPLTLDLFIKNDDGWLAKYLLYFSVPAFLAILILQLTDVTRWDPLLAGIFFAFSVMISVYGLMRFFQRGFIHMEEFLIDIGFIYLVIGGAWFVAFETGINTGFSPMITWLTAIHFHYSALDRKSTRLNSSHVAISYAVFCV